MKKGRRDWPSLHAIAKHGGFTILRDEASRPGAYEHALAQDDARRQQASAPTALKAKRAADHAAWAASEQAQALLAVFAGGEETTRAQIQELLGWRQGTLQIWLNRLREAGLVTGSVPLGQKRKNARYWTAKSV